MIKRNNRKIIRMEEMALKDGSTPEKTIEFEFENHSNIFFFLESGRV